MRENLSGIHVHIALIGEKAEEYIAKKGNPDNTFRDAEGNIVVAAFSGRKKRAALGTEQVTFGLVEQTDNREVTLYGGVLGNGTRGRKVSLTNKTGEGRQQLTKGVDIMVRTDAPVEVFKANSR